jgi:hypothetical protein
VTGAFRRSCPHLGDVQPPALATFPGAIARNVASQCGCVRVGAPAPPIPPNTHAGSSRLNSSSVADRSDKISCLGARQLVDHALAGPLPLLQEDQEIGHLLPVRPLVELPDDVGADLAGGGQDPKQSPPPRWSERASQPNRILPKHRGASVSAAGPPKDSCRTQLLERRAAPRPDAP